MTRRRIAVLISAAVAAVGLGAGLALAVSSTGSPCTATARSVRATPSRSEPAFSPASRTNQKVNSSVAATPSMCHTRRGPRVARFQPSRMRSRNSSPNVNGGRRSCLRVPLVRHTWDGRWP